MVLVRLYKGCKLQTVYEEITRWRLERLRETCPQVGALQLEICYYIEIQPRSGDVECSDLQVLLGSKDAGRLGKILGDIWVLEDDLNAQTQLVVQDSTRELLVEIGPRLSFKTAWCTNAVSICHAAGITAISRLEKSDRYIISVNENITAELHRKIVEALHDPMTEQEYRVPLESFKLDVQPEQWTEVDVIGRGVDALKEANETMGLAFDEWDVKYYTEMFQTKVCRNPTTVELFDLAQSNSEHSRHWFFKGEYTVDGEKLPTSLFEMVMSTNTASTTNTNNVIAFSDNSSGVIGWDTLVLIPKDPRKASPVTVEKHLRHLIFTAETHNFPTGVAPFSGATTGTGGRIRDVQAAGRGGHVVAGTAGYCFGNLHIPDYDLPWEVTANYPSNFASPLEVAIEASNGASDYGNKFGEPVIAGFARSFGSIIGTGLNTERREWIKPIMFSGGMGTLDESMVKKLQPEKGHRVVKLGGPIYRIGVGGGAASSIQVQGDNAVARDLGAVQRGDAEMEQKLNRVVRGCLEMKVNPILAIHDQGAGGNANVLKELMEGAGGAIFRDAFKKGDPTLSTLEVWGAEYQESNALLAAEDTLSSLQVLAARERCPVDVVGVITGDDKVRLIEEDFNVDLLEVPEKSDTKHPVDLNLDWVLGKMPRKEFHWTKQRVLPSPLHLPQTMEVEEALGRVLKLPSVASKRYLTNKVDRSVTGLVAQQQCVGPLHTPLADVAVTAASYFSKEGTATSIGEQPIKMLVSPVAGARMTVLEALANLAAAPISDLKDVKCSANWMWAAKLPGEGWLLYEACAAMCEVMKALGIGIDGGKDSLSMAARVPNANGEPSVVKAPGTLVVSAYAPCPDITKVVTPDLKSPSMGGEGCLLWVRPAPARARLGGTALAQVYCQVGTDAPDVNENETVAFIQAFRVIQQLIEKRAVLAMHDVSDGGLVTCLIEMAIGGWSGLSVDLPPAPAPSSSSKDEASPLIAALFSEEIGWVLEVESNACESILEQFITAGVPGTSLLGTTTSTGPHAQITVKVGGQLAVNMTVAEAAKLWEETSYQLERKQSNPKTALAEFKALDKRKHTTYTVPFSYRDFTIGPDHTLLSIPHVAVVREEGSNGDREMISALLQAGFSVHDVTMTDLIGGDVKLDSFRGIVFPGGFSYADVLGSAVGWSSAIQGNENLKKSLEEWRNKPTTFSLGVCNGCQLMAQLGWLNAQGYGTEMPQIRLAPNVSGRYESRWCRVQIEESKSILLKDMGGSKLGIWVAHGEGRFIYASDSGLTGPDVLTMLQSSKCVALRYLDEDDKPTETYPFNPNGSQDGIAGITSSCGRHLAMMPHPERCVLTWQWPHIAPPLALPPVEPRLTAPWSKLFQNAYDWCLEN